jgi:hypothetical protein
MTENSFTKDYSFHLRWLSLKTLILEVFLEDFIHWWLIYPVLNLFLEEGYYLNFISSIIFALGHLGRNPRKAATQLDFWKRKFPLMLIMGWVYSQINKKGKLYITLFHLVWNITWLVLIPMLAPPEKPGDWLLQMAAYYERNPPPPKTQEEIRKEEEWRKEFGKAMFELIKDGKIKMAKSE